MRYRYLREGEIVKLGDEFDASNDGWRDWPDWKPVTHERGGLGRKAADPIFPSHVRYRRKLTLRQRIMRWLLYRRIDRLARSVTDADGGE